MKRRSTLENKSDIRSVKKKHKENNNISDSNTNYHNSKNESFESVIKAKECIDIIVHTSVENHDNIVKYERSRRVSFSLPKESDKDINNKNANKKALTGGAQILLFLVAAFIVGCFLMSPGKL